MTALGKSLVFYFKYWAEMQRLCESEGGELEGLPETEKTREMAQAVRGKAKMQAADLLEACTPGLELHFKSIGKCQRIGSRGILERKWSMSFGVWTKNKPAKWKMQVSVDVVRLDRPEIVPWVWRLGGEEAEKTLEFILGDRAKARSEDIGWSAGTVGLDRIPILPDALGGFDLDREPLVERVHKAFRAFTRPHLDQLYP